MKAFRIYIIVGAALLVVYLIAQLNKPTPTNWNKTYKPADKIPFGTYILYTQLTDVFKEAKISRTSFPVYNTLKNTSKSNTLYLIVADRVEMDENDYKQILKFVEKGNSVFIAAGRLSGYLGRQLKLKYGFDKNFLTAKGKQAVNFVSPSLKTATHYVFSKEVGLKYFSQIDTAKMTVLGRLNTGEANFVKLTKGKGELYVLADPLFFTNYNLLEPRGAEYAAKALSYVNSYNTVLYDNYYNGSSQQEQSIFRFLLDKPNLKYAYILTVSAMLLFLAFEIKRRQRIIPVAEPFTNTTVDFVHVVTNVYLAQKDHRNIALKQIAYFLEHLRARYFWQAHYAEEDFALRLQQKTGVGEELAKALDGQIKFIADGQPISEETLINLNSLIESFYKESK